jgi:putative flavoprotein involved in K+ transport
LLPAGGVLVVGSAQSGCQIAADLRESGPQVVLATSAVGRVPVRYRGRAAIDWLVTSGFFDQRAQDLPDPAMAHATNPILAPGYSLSLQTLARRGVTLAGRLVAVDGERATFDDSAHANVAAGDAFAARARRMVDDAIERGGLIAAPAEPDDADGPVDVDPPSRLDLGADGIGSVVWCTGFTGDFTWLGSDLLDAGGRPHHENAAAPAPGLWYLGLRWLIRRGSGILFGIPGDAVTVADAVNAYLRNGHRTHEILGVPR